MWPILIGPTERRFSIKNLENTVPCIYIYMKDTLVEICFFFLMKNRQNHDKKIEVDFLKEKDSVLLFRCRPGESF